MTEVFAVAQTVLDERDFIAGEQVQIRPSAVRHVSHRRGVEFQVTPMP